MKSKWSGVAFNGTLFTLDMLKALKLL